MAAQEASFNCSYQVEPDRFLAGEAQAWRLTKERLAAYRAFAPAGSRAATVDASTLPRRGYIDNHIFDKLAEKQVPAARLTNDYEFVRRIYLDLTGRIPTIAQVREFVDDGSANKRDALIERLLYTPEFTDRWMIWLGDLMQNAAQNSNEPLQIKGRNAFHTWLRRSLDQQRSLKDIVWESLVARGNNYDAETAGANFSVRHRTGGGPAQDTYDTALNRAATQFLGISHYDCVLCHDGRGHLDQLSLWGRTARRTEAQRMAAFFSRVRYRYVSNDRNHPYYQSWEVTDATSGQYDLNTTFGNRPNRAPVGTVRNLTPEYRTGAVPADGDWRGAFANFLVSDRMFSRNLANRIWKQVFNQGLVEPVDQLDPARLDPENPPSGNWTLQASHPQLLESLAIHLEGLNFDLREFLKVLMQSTAYQLSSEYDGTWRVDYAPLFARHYPRRLEGEEVHDTIQVATNVLGNYTVGEWPEPVRWAIQLPEPVEPRSNAAVANFMNSFLRGNRDTQERLQNGSILQQLNLMNDRFVTDRIRNAQSPTVRRLATATDVPAAVDELFLQFLTRLPTPSERAKAVRFIEEGGPSRRNATAEDLAWALINRTEFIFSY